jgi:hypothetical protein
MVTEKDTKFFKAIAKSYLKVSLEASLKASGIAGFKAKLFIE